MDVLVPKPKPTPSRRSLSSSRGRRIYTDGNPLFEGQRNEGLFKRGAGMRNAGLVDGELEDALLETNRNCCRPPLPDGEVLGIARSIATRYPPGEGAQTATREKAATPRRACTMIGASPRMRKGRRPRSEDIGALSVSEPIQGKTCDRSALIVG